ncbi:pyruvate kinase [Nitrosomonas halophila]|uniref:Pyruvate kinase n=1 Tax=Nitrosomonas halophila TaxID=44576 RepID=A0A1H3D875_9PROT|nr:pyruvate kinase [Nitrosomonas halophila]
MVEIVQAQDSGEKLVADQGINLPDTRFNTTGLTSDDIESLNFVVHHADIVGLSLCADFRMLSCCSTISRDWALQAWGLSLRSRRVRRLSACLKFCSRCCADRLSV